MRRHPTDNMHSAFVSFPYVDVTQSSRTSQAKADSCSGEGAIREIRRAKGELGVRGAATKEHCGRESDKRLNVGSVAVHAMYSELLPYET